MNNIIIFVIAMAIASGASMLAVAQTTPTNEISDGALQFSVQFKTPSGNVMSMPIYADDLAGVNNEIKRLEIGFDKIHAIIPTGEKQPTPIYSPVIFPKDASMTPNPPAEEREDGMLK